MGDPHALWLLLVVSQLPAWSFPPHLTTAGCPAAGIDFKKGFADQVALLGQWVERHGLAPGVAPPSAVLTPAQSAELAQLVGRSCQLCQAALRSEGVRVVELISQDPATLSTGER